MSRDVIIEGSQTTPSDRLGRGVRAKVTLTRDILKLVKNGSVIIVDQPVPDGVIEAQTWTPGDSTILPEVPESAYGPDSTPLTPINTSGPKPPPRNGATPDWQDWVLANVPGAEIEGKTRDELIAIWQEFDGE